MKNCNEKVFVGVDCHKNSIACFVNGKFREFKTDFKGFNKALEWVKQQNITSAWAPEGAYSTTAANPYLPDSFSELEDAEKSKK